MQALDVINLYNDLEDVGIEVWLDGGWGVDALLQKETRPHADVDIVVQEKDLIALTKHLEEDGYQTIERDDTRAWNFVLGNASGKLVDVHVVVLDKNGNGIYGPVENGVAYPAVAFTGVGRIGSQTVRCLSAEYQVASHSGYRLKEKDWRDVAALCDKYGIALPKEYASFGK